MEEVAGSMGKGTEFPHGIASLSKKTEYIEETGDMECLADDKH